MNAEELQQKAIDFVISLPEDKQEIFTDGVDRLVNVMNEAREQGIEFSEEDLTHIFVYAFAQTLLLLNDKQ